MSSRTRLRTLKVLAAAAVLAAIGLGGHFLIRAVIALHSN